MTLLLRFLTLIAIAVLMGCTDTAAPKNADHAKRAVATFLIEQHFDQWDQYYHDNASVNGSDFAMTIMKGTAQSLHHSFPDVELRVVEQITNGDKVVTRFVLAGTHEGYFSNIKPTMRRVEFDGMSIDEFRDGRIQKTFMLLDLYRLGTELSAKRGGS
jgi:predicted ester cyclase